MTTLTADVLERLPVFAKVTVVASGALHTSVSVVYQLMNPDGISYLDIADAYMRRDWHMAINAVWSPLYSWLLVPVLAAVRRPIPWEFRLVHLANFAIFISAFAAFEFFWTQLLRYARTGRTSEKATDDGTLPKWAVRPESSETDVRAPALWPARLANGDRGRHSPAAHT